MAAGKGGAALGLCMKWLTSTFGLFLINLTYLLLGAWLFMAIEAPREESLQNNLEEERDTLVQQILLLGQGPEEHYIGNASEKLAKYELSLANFYRKRATFKLAAGNDSVAGLRLWTAAGSIIYCYSVITTIGWGNIVPATLNGRLGTVIYGLNGMPLLFTLSSEVGASCSSAIFMAWSNFCNTIRPLIGKNVKKAKGHGADKDKANTEDESEDDDDEENETENESQNNPSRQRSSQATARAPTSAVDQTVTDIWRHSTPMARSQLKSAARNGQASSQTTYLGSLRSCVDFMLYAWFEAHSGRTPQYQPHYLIRCKQDCMLLCEQFSRMSEDEMCKCMEYSGFHCDGEVTCRTLDTPFVDCQFVNTSRVPDKYALVPEERGPDPGVRCATDDAGPSLSSCLMAHYLMSENDDDTQDMIVDTRTNRAKDTSQDITAGSGERYQHVLRRSAPREQEIAVVKYQGLQAQSSRPAGPGEHAWQESKVIGSHLLQPTISAGADVSRVQVHNDCMLHIPHSRRQIMACETLGSMQSAPLSECSYRRENGKHNSHSTGLEEHHSPRTTSSDCVALSTGKKINFDRAARSQDKKQQDMSSPTDPSKKQQDMSSPTDPSKKQQDMSSPTDPSKKQQDMSSPTDPSKKQQDMSSPTDPSKKQQDMSSPTEPSKKQQDMSSPTDPSKKQQDMSSPTEPSYTLALAGLSKEISKLADGSHPQLTGGSHPQLADGSHPQLADLQNYLTHSQRRDDCTSRCSVNLSCVSFVVEASGLNTVTLSPAMEYVPADRLFYHSHDALQAITGSRSHCTQEASLSVVGEEQPERQEASLSVVGEEQPERQEDRRALTNQHTTQTSGSNRWQECPDRPVQVVGCHVGAIQNVTQRKMHGSICLSQSRGNSLSFYKDDQLSARHAQTKTRLISREMHVVVEFPLGARQESTKTRAYTDRVPLANCSGRGRHKNTSSLRQEGTRTPVQEGTCAPVQEGARAPVCTANHPIVCTANHPIVCTANPRTLCTANHPMVHASNSEPRNRMVHTFSQNSYQEHIFNSQSDNSRSDNSQSDNSRSDNSQSDNSRSGNSQSDNSRSDNSQSGNSQSDNSRSGNSCVEMTERRKVYWVSESERGVYLESDISNSGQVNLTDSAIDESMRVAATDTCSDHVCRRADVNNHDKQIRSDFAAEMRENLKDNIQTRLARGQTCRDTSPELLARTTGSGSVQTSMGRSRDIRCPSRLSQAGNNCKSNLRAIDNLGPILDGFAVRDRNGTFCVADERDKSTWLLRCGGGSHTYKPTRQQEDDKDCAGGMTPLQLFNGDDYIGQADGAFLGEEEENTKRARTNTRDQKNINQIASIRLDTFNTETGSSTMSLGDRDTRVMSLSDRDTRVMSLGDRDTRVMSLSDRDTRVMSLGDRDTRVMSDAHRDTRIMSASDRRQKGCVKTPQWSGRHVLTERGNSNTNKELQEVCTIYSSGRNFEYDDDDDDDANFVSGRGMGFNMKKRREKDERVEADRLAYKRHVFGFAGLGYLHKDDEKVSPVLDTFHMPLVFLYSMIILYVAIGSFIFFTWEKGINFWDALYFIYVLLSTTGFGDILPSPQLYAFIVVYALIGMAVYNIMINATLELFLEVLEYLASVGDIDETKSPKANK